MPARHGSQITTIGLDLVKHWFQVRGVDANGRIVDTADAEAICEAVTRPSMRFVPVKDVEQQSVLVLHRACSLLVRQSTMLVNVPRAHMAECHFNFAQAVTFQSCADISLGDVSGESANCLSSEHGPSTPS